MTKTVHMTKSVPLLLTSLQRTRQSPREVSRQQEEKGCTLTGVYHLCVFCKCKDAVSPVDFSKIHNLPNIWPKFLTDRVRTFWEVRIFLAGPHNFIIRF